LLTAIATAHVISQMNDDLLRQNPRRGYHLILQCRNALDKLFMDPWFTSLRTLQEALLCLHAYLLSREAVTDQGYTAAREVACDWHAT